MNDLKELIHTTQESRELKRALAVKNTLAGRPWLEVAEELGVCRACIGKWRQRYAQEGVDSLRLHYHGSTGYLTSQAKAEVMAWLQEQDHWLVIALRPHMLYTYGVRYKSRQSYDALLAEARMSWKKTQDTHPKADPKAIDETRQTIKKNMSAEAVRMVSKEVLVFFLDECHLVWGDALGYAWGPMGERGEVPIENVRERQTYYGALNLLTGRPSLFPAEKGNGACTVAFLKWLRWRHQCRPMICLWDRASYHWCQEVKRYLRTLNGDRPASERAIQLIPFARYAPEQNPMEDVWLAGKRQVRNQWYRLETFADVTQCFSTTVLFHSSVNHEKLNWYGRLQLI